MSSRTCLPDRDNWTTREQHRGLYREWIEDYRGYFRHPTALMRKILRDRDLLQECHGDLPHLHLTIHGHGQRRLEADH